MRNSGAAVVVLAFLIAGCSTNAPTASQSPLVGTWVLNVARTTAAAASDPKLARSVTGAITFAPDGKYQSSITFNNHTNEGSGTWRLLGPDVYITPDKGREGHLVLQGNDLIDHAHHEPGAMIYERKP